MGLLLGGTQFQVASLWLPPLGHITNEGASNFSSSHYGIVTYSNGINLTVPAASLQDVTGSVDANGHLNIQLPSNVTGLLYRIFAFYQNYATHREQAPPWYLESNAPGSAPRSQVMDFQMNGSWVADHLSSAGAQMVIGFWNTYMLVNGSRELLQEVGNYRWEDSQEFGAGTLVWWTPVLLKKFRTSRGYDLTKYLPLIYAVPNGNGASLASWDHVYTDEVDEGHSHIEDHWHVVSGWYQRVLRGGSRY